VIESVGGGRGRQRQRKRGLSGHHCNNYHVCACVHVCVCACVCVYSYVCVSVCVGRGAHRCVFACDLTGVVGIVGVVRRGVGVVK